MLTKQEIFTKVYETLRERGFTRAGISQSDETGSYFSCRYHSPVGPCAIGIFITDEEYDSFYENTPASHAIEGMCSTLREPFVNYGSKFFNALQGAHDEGYTPKKMAENLHQFAKAFGLEIPS